MSAQLDRKQYHAEYRAANKAKKLAYNEANKAKLAAYHADYRAKNKAKLASYQVEYRVKNPHKGRAKTDRYRAANPDKVAAVYKAWALANPDKLAAAQAEYRARKINATPSWLTAEDYREILDLYAEAKAIGHHVDHIVPLRGTTVSGLHVPWNLQLLSPAENLKKSNRLIQERNLGP
jgi:hypothetical protein